MVTGHPKAKLSAATESCRAVSTAVKSLPGICLLPNVSRKVVGVSGNMAVVVEISSIMRHAVGCG